VGARHLIASYPEAVAEVPVTGNGALVDVDTPDALRAVRAEIEG
jgi:molybdenum cofactor cytidylyltransferase